MSLTAEESQLVKITPTAPAVVWNYEEMEAWARGVVEKYQGLVVTEDQVTDIKAIMADINARKITLDNARKRTITELKKPLDDFSAQVKRVMGIFDETYAALSAQVQAFTNAEREKKRGVVEGIIKEVMGAYDIEPFEIPVQDKWLNKTTTQKAIRETVVDIINQRIEADNARRAAEQAQRDRCAAIEAHVKALNAQAGVEVPLAQFMAPAFTDAARPLEDVLPLVGQRHAEAVAAQRPAAYSPAEDEEDVAAEQARLDGLLPPPLPTAVDNTASDTTLTLIVTYAPANAEKVKSIVNQLRGVCTSVACRRR